MNDTNFQNSTTDESRGPGDGPRAAIQAARSEAFRALHIPGSPLVLFNAWDVGSAQAIMESGAEAIAVNAWTVAVAHGFDEVAHMPDDLYIGNLQRIATSSHLPVTASLCGFHSACPSSIAEEVTRLLMAGAVGFSITDAVDSNGTLRDISDQATLISTARVAGDDVGVRPFLYARTEVFCQTWPDQHSEDMVEVAAERGCAFATAGADSLFVPGLSDLRLIDRLVERSPLPVSVMIGDQATSIQELARAGVACVTFGLLPYLKAMSAVRDEARAVLILSSQAQRDWSQVRSR